MAVCHYCGRDYRGGVFSSLCSVCQQAYRGGYIRRCVCCGKYITRDEAVPITTYGDEAYLCPHCAEHEVVGCGYCNAVTIRSACVCDSTGTHFVCGHHGIQRCSLCGGLHARCIEVGDSTVCPSCADHPEMKWRARVSREQLLKPFDYKPMAYRLQHNGEKKKIYLGFELEAGYLENKTAQAKAICKVSDVLGDNGFIKHDGSIPKFGFEVVSQPMTLSVHRCTPWEEVIKTMVNEGMYIYKEVENPERDTHYPCGLHVHVSRDALTQQKWITLDWFIQRYKKFWEVISRRPQSEYAKYKSLSGVKRKRMKLRDVCGYSSDRYQAINFCNRNTVEFRLFNSTLDYEVLMRTLEVVHAAVTWADEVHACDIIKEGAVKSFISHMKSNKQYVETVKWIDKLF